MLLEEILKHIDTIGIEDFVIEGDLFDDVNDLIAPAIHTESVFDVRSAAFYACGTAQKTDKPVGLIIRKDYLPNTLTGLTEAWFQRRKIIVFAVGSHILNENTEYFRNCTHGRYKIQGLDDFAEYSRDSLAGNGPVLFLIEDDTIGYRPAAKINVKLISEKLGSKAKLFVYSALLPQTDIKAAEVILPQDRYGIISKYAGFCTGSDDLCVLIIDYDCIKLDMNIFNNRYLSNKFKLIVTCRHADKNVVSWLGKNNIEVLTAENEEAAADSLLEADKAAAVFLSSSGVV